MTRFATALQTWFTSHKSTSIRGLSEVAGLTATALSNFRAGKHPITLDALSKLLPAIEKHGTRTEALTLHVAYLFDEVVAGYEQDLTITAIDPQTSTSRVDAIDLRARKWAKKSRLDADFESMWDSLDRFIIGTDDVIADLTIDALARAEDAKRTGTFAPEPNHPTSDGPQAKAAAVATAFMGLREEPPQPGVVPTPAPEHKPVNYKDVMKKPRKSQSKPIQEE